MIHPVQEQRHAALMRFAFAQIAGENYKHGQIDAIVYWDVANVYMQAIEFMTATQPTCERLADKPGLCRVYSPGLAPR